MFAIIVFATLNLLYAAATAVICYKTRNDAEIRASHPTLWLYVLPFPVLHLLLSVLLFTFSF